MSSKEINTKVQLSGCDRACTDCHLKYFFEKHQDNPQFNIQCGGIPTEYIADEVLSQFSEGERDHAIGLMDPVVWAEITLGWVARWYQIEMLRCDSRYKVFRTGRRVGKSATMAIGILHRTIVNKGHKTLVLAPLKAQTGELFETIKKLINTNTGLSNSVRRIVGSPYPTIEFHNDSIIKFFTAGTSSGSGALSTRGQSANLLIMDEADYLATEDVNAFLAIRVESPNVQVWASSTPTGKRQHFYEWTKSDTWREFHYPSSVLPHWSPELEKECRKDAGTELNYVHEYEAGWGEDEQGVYQKSYVQLAQRDYQYSDMKVEDDWIYTMGVDWNDTKVGVEIAVVGYNPRNNWHYIVSRERVSKEGYTQTAAMEKIVLMNRIWNPKFIYVDAGHGGTQYENLTKYGWESLQKQGPNHPDSRLRYMLKKYDFGSTVEVHDPHTGQLVPKPAKAFLVNNSVRCFEQQEVKISKHDSELISQLHGYIIDRLTPTGNPVYKADKKWGDHGLDAVNLALVAFKLEMTNWGNPPVVSTIGFGGNFGAGRETQIVSPFQIEVKLDPQYEMKKRIEMTEQNRNQYDRGVDEDERKPRSQLPDQLSTTVKKLKPWYRPGWSSDEEWKFDREQKHRRGAKQRHNFKSGRRSSL